MTTETGLIVPIDIAAVCVGSEDANNITSSSERFGGTLTWYTELAGNNQAFLGSTITKSLFDTPIAETALEAGIHLHWALPDALTHVPNPVTQATQEKRAGAQLAFPAVPNRWLVTRFILDGANPGVPQSWIVESDALLDEANIPDKQKPITLPVRAGSDGSDIGHSYVGQHKAFDPTWTEPDTSTFKSQTGNELSAVASGVVSFGAFYPNSRSVLGFVDLLAGVDAGNLMYVVCGWYSNAVNDPLNGGTSLADIQQKYEWTFDGDGLPTFAICYGLVQAIEWDPKKENYFSTANVPPSAKATVAIGNNPAEALSAYFQDFQGIESSYFQSLFTAFQNGALSKYIKTPQTDQLSKLDEALHRQGFAAYNAGTLYSVVKPPTDPTKGQTDDPKITLPPKLASDLNLLNLYQQQYDFCQFHSDNFRWQLFADWYAYCSTLDSSEPSHLNDNAFQKLGDRYGSWQELSDDCSALHDKLNTQKAMVTQQLGATLLLKAEPAPRYWQPNEPVVALISDDIEPARRYGGDGRYHPDQYLHCRLTTQTLSAVTVNGHALQATQFTNAGLPAGHQAPHAPVLDALLQEACLLNTQLAAHSTSATADTLSADLRAALIDADSQSVYTFTPAHAQPSPVGVNWWQGENPWLPLMLQWTVNFQPILATENAETLIDYPPTWFLDNYQVEQNQGGRILYHPTETPIDPAAAAYDQTYAGVSILNSKGVAGLEQQLTAYLASTADATLESILKQIQSTNVLVQSLSGFNDRLLMREQAVQMPVKVSSSSTNSTLIEATRAVAPIIGNANNLSPIFQGHFNPLRAGYMKLSLVIVGAFGEKRPVDITKFICAESLTTYKEPQAVPAYEQSLLDGTPTAAPETIPNVVALPPRIAQPSRLLFRWIAATSDGYDEMNTHPASSPVCGWVMPNHLDGSLFLYNQQGKSLGTLYLNGAESAVLWQSAPGDNQTVNQSLSAVLQHGNPQLYALATRLQADASFFKGMWRAIDESHASVNPHDKGNNENLAVLVGKPLALVQTSLRLETQGPPALNQSYKALEQTSWQLTDNNFSAVTFPVIIGDLQQMNDGLIGYFKQNSAHTAYALDTFYSEGADGTDANVIIPSPTNIQLTLSPHLVTDPTTLDVAEKPAENDQKELPYAQTGTEKLLMLVDPRACVHATTGILPTQSIAIPADQYVATLSTLEMTFLIAPILRAIGGLSLPLPQEHGYEWSWVEEEPVAGGSDIAWMVDSELLRVSNKAIWNYTPQKIGEGWLRLNPQLLEFRLRNSAQHPVVVNGQANNLTLEVTNKKGVAITFNPSPPIREGDVSTGSIFYLHFSQLVKDGDIPNIALAADGWTFKRYNDPQYGDYWAATTANPVMLAPNQSITFTVNNVVVSSTQLQAYVYFDYYAVDGLNDGVFDDLLTIQPKPSTP